MNTTIYASDYLKLDSDVYNGGGLILSVLVSVLLFKEKLSWKQSIGVLLGIIATLLLCK